MTLIFSINLEKCCFFLVRELNNLSSNNHLWLSIIVLWVGKCELSITDQFSPLKLKDLHFRTDCMIGETLFSTVQHARLSAGVLLGKIMISCKKY